MTVSDNQRRARTGGDAVWCAASLSALTTDAPARDAVIAALRDIAHFCDHVGVTPLEVLRLALAAHRDDIETRGRVPAAARPDVALAAQVADLDAA